MGLIKDIYSADFYDHFSRYLQRHAPSFNKKKFLSRIFDEGFAQMEWKERMQHTTRVMHSCLPADYPEAVNSINRIIADLRADGAGEDSLAYVIFPDYISSYGLADLKTSTAAIENITQFVSCEFAVRPFILQYHDKMMAQMLKWSLHKHYKVRRLASEGSRPRLPWAMAIPALKKDPAPLLPLLENLKNDPAEWVRKSVANNLNDISKDHPAIVLEIAGKWRGLSKATDAIIKHCCRTLLKQGHADVLQQYGLDGKGLTLSGFKILTPTVKIGDNLAFSFSINNSNETPKMVRLEYGVYYRKANGNLARKVFKISERDYQPGETIAIHRKQSFRIITTRKFYEGKHDLSIIVNGAEKGVKSFMIVE